MENFPMSKRLFVPSGTPKLSKNIFEKAAWLQGGLVCGIDEVGRGCLAGPLVTAAVIIPANKHMPLLKDSKILSPEEREKAARWITKHCWYGIGIVHNRLIDERNIWQATLVAMKRALVQLLATSPHMPQTILVDAMPLNLLDTVYRDIPVYYFPKGETFSTSIAAASIIAKVKRDAIMNSLDPVFPAYSFAQHKGYGTKLHRDALQEQSYSIIHRLSYLEKNNNLESDNSNQQSILTESAYDTESDQSNE
jgi:ribonuclease HII